MTDHRTYKHYFSSCEILKSLTKTQAWTGFEPMTSADECKWGVRITFRPEFFSGFNFTTAVVCITAMISHNRIFLRSSNIWFSYIIWILYLPRVYYELTMWPALSWLDSSVGRALPVSQRSESRSGLNFFQALISQLLKLCVNCDDQW